MIMTYDPFNTTGAQPMPQYGQPAQTYQTATGAPPAPQFQQQPAQPVNQYGLTEQDQQFYAQQQAASAPPAADTSGFFSGGGVAMSFRDRSLIGKPRGGQIVGKRMGIQRDMDGKQKLWDDGTPRQQVIVTLQTNERVSADDDGKRELYVKSGMVAAVREAIREASVGDLEVGGWLFIAWVGEKPSGKGNPSKVYKAQYTKLGAPAPALASAPPPQMAAPAPQPGAQAAPPSMTTQQAAQVFGAPPAAPQGQPVPNPFG